MATTQQVAAPQSKKGCSAIVVFMLSSLAVVAGVVVGAVALVIVLQADPTTATNLGIELPATETVVAVPPQSGDGAAAKGAKAPAAKADYALLYPIEESLRIEGDLDGEKVKRQIKERRYQLRECYQTGIAADPDLKGEMGLQFTVSKSGKVLVAVERHTDFGSERVKQCILDELKKWTFPGKYKGMSVVKFDVLMIPISSAAAGAAESE